jgi:sodium pump decarboxylase gamma subunit
MNNLVFGLSITAIGLVIVFAGLIVLIGFIKLVSAISNVRAAKDKADTETDDAAIVYEDALPAVEVEQGIAPETVAAITAAIAAVWQGDTGFIVRHVRRVHNAAAWNLAGREDQVYSRM